MSAVIGNRAAFDRLRRVGMAVPMQPMLGRVTSATGTIIRAIAPNVRVGELCRLTDETGFSLFAEVVGLAGVEALMTPIGDLRGVSGRTEVRPTGTFREAPVGSRLLGRVVDALGEPMDGRGPIGAGPMRPLHGLPPNALSRQLVEHPMPLGLRVMDGLLTVGEGQRIGIYGEAGGGKSTLVSQIVRGAAADVAVIALVGERGREVREFLERALGPEGLARSVVVVATSERPAPERLSAALVATSIAEEFRDQGMKVLLFVDNVTRLARAGREIGLSAGEPPTRRGFPPSVFAAMPQLMERAGPGETGSITAFYAVLVEEGTGDPIAEETRGILDGHIILSRSLAAANHYPAVDVLLSRSRVMPAVTSKEHGRVAGRFRELMSKHAEVEFLIQVGEYKPGSDALVDEAVAKIDHLRAFLRQSTDEHTPYEETLAWMTQLVG